MLYLLIDSNLIVIYLLVIVIIDKSSKKKIGKYKWRSISIQNLQYKGHRLLQDLILVTLFAMLYQCYYLSKKLICHYKDLSAILLQQTEIERCNFDFEPIKR